MGCFLVSWFLVGKDGDRRRRENKRSVLAKELFPSGWYPESWVSNQGNGLRGTT